MKKMNTGLNNGDLRPSCYSAFPKRRVVEECQSFTPHCAIACQGVTENLTSIEVNAACVGYQTKKSDEPNLTSAEVNAVD